MSAVVLGIRNGSLTTYYSGKCTRAEKDRYSDIKSLSLSTFSIFLTPLPTLYYINKKRRGLFVPASHYTAAEPGKQLQSIL